MKKKKKSKFAGDIKFKPYTVKQENDIFLGKVLFWTFIVSFPASVLLVLGMSWNIRVCFLIWGILSLLDATYNLLGLIFKWDHARVCAKSHLKKTHKFDIRNAWSKEDTKDSITEIVMCGTIGVISLIGAICHFR